MTSRSQRSQRSEKPLAERLGLKSGMQIAVLNAPDEVMPEFEPLPEGASIERTSRGVGEFDAAVVFVRNAGEVAEFVPPAMQTVRRGGLLWCCYPKGGSGIETDINRDRGWEPLREAGWRPVRQVAVDDTWSALRFRPEDEVRSR